MYSKANVEWRDIFKSERCLSLGPKHDIRFIILKIQCIRSLFRLYHFRDLPPVLRNPQYFIEGDNNLDLRKLSLQVKRRSKSLNKISLYLFSLQVFLFGYTFFWEFFILGWGNLWKIFLCNLLLHHLSSGMTLGRLTS